ncbi:hypothetical protein D8I24_3626 [Cupriavidus necator H850]|nr:hypothetical protein D8I24_3626 [Cupriavidus necator H850]
MARSIALAGRRPYCEDRASEREALWDKGCGELAVASVRVNPERSARNASMN